MGGGSSVIYDARGQEIGLRRCVLLVTPPGYEVSRLVSQVPSSLGYEYVSVGQMIRDEINKKTNYSRIILQNLQQYHKINEKILDILLKNAALLGNFMIRFAPRDSEELTIWKKFVDKVGVDLVVIVRGEGEESVVKRPSFRDKFKIYENEVEQVRDIVGKDSILLIDRQENAGDKIAERLKDAQNRQERFE